jgi:hypothetical protein
MDKTGQCMCGAVTVKATLSSDILNVCNCDMCRRWTGSEFISVRVHQDSIVLDGPVQRFQSSEWAERGFCGTCGSTLFYRLTADVPGHGDYNFAAGMFDTRDMKIGLEFFVDTKPQGYALSGNHTRLTRAETAAHFGVSFEEDGKNA